MNTPFIVKAYSGVRLRHKPCTTRRAGREEEVMKMNARSRYSVQEKIKAGDGKTAEVRIDFHGAGCEDGHRMGKRMAAYLRAAQELPAHG